MMCCAPSYPEACGTPTPMRSRRVKLDGRLVATVPMKYSGKPKLLRGRRRLTKGGVYEVTVYALIDQKTATPVSTGPLHAILNISRSSCATRGRHETQTSVIPRRAHHGRHRSDACPDGAGGRTDGGVRRSPASPDPGTALEQVLPEERRGSEKRPKPTSSTTGSPVVFDDSRQTSMR